MREKAWALVASLFAIGASISSPVQIASGAIAVCASLGAYAAYRDGLPDQRKESWWDRHVWRRRHAEVMHELGGIKELNTATLAAVRDEKAFGERPRIRIEIVVGEPVMSIRDEVRRRWRLYIHNHGGMGRFRIFVTVLGKSPKSLVYLERQHPGCGAHA